MSPSPKHRSTSRVRPFNAPGQRAVCRYAMPMVALGAISLAQVVAPGTAYAETTAPVSQTPSKPAPSATAPVATATQETTEATPPPAPAPVPTEEPTPEPTPATATTEEEIQEPSSEPAPEPTTEPVVEPIQAVAPTPAPAPLPEPVRGSVPTAAPPQTTEKAAPAAAEEPVPTTGPLRIVLDDYAVAGGDTVTGTLAGVDPAAAEAPAVTITGDVLNPNGSTSTVTLDCGVSGNEDPATFDCDVPADAVPGSTWTATATQGDRSTSTTFTIDGEASEQEIASVDIVQYEDIEVTGSGWDPEQAVTITLTGPNGETLTLSATPDADGDFTVTAPSDLSTTPGVWTATASNGSGDQASTTFNVTAYEPDPKIATCGILRLSTGLGATAPLPYDVSGFYPGETATITATDPDGNTTTQTVTVNADGTFSGSFTADASGVWYVNAIQGVPVAGAPTLTAQDYCRVTIIGTPPPPPPPTDYCDTLPGVQGKDEDCPPPEEPTDYCDTLPGVQGKDEDCPPDEPPPPPVDFCSTLPGVQGPLDECPPPPPPPTDYCDSVPGIQDDPEDCPVELPTDYCPALPGIQGDPGLCPEEPENPNPPTTPTENPTFEPTPTIVNVVNPTDAPTIAPTPTEQTQAPSPVPTPEAETRPSALGCDDEDGIEEASDHDADEDGYCDNPIVDARFASDRDSWVKDMWLGGLALWGGLLIAGWWFLFGKRRHDDAEA